MLYGAPYKYIMHNFYILRYDFKINHVIGCAYCIFVAAELGRLSVLVSTTTVATFPISSMSSIAPCR